MGTQFYLNISDIHFMINRRRESSFLSYLTIFEIILNFDVIRQNISLAQAILMNSLHPFSNSISYQIQD